MKESGPSFKKIEAINKKIAELKNERSEVQVDLPQINKIAGSIKQKISKVKSQDKEFGTEKKLY